jgi:GntR family transcriptional regulator/MocR family aminotransferase
MADALQQVFRNRIALELQPGGLNLVVRLRGRVQDKKLARLAQQAGLAVGELSNRIIEHDCGQGLLLGFANTPEEEALRMIRRLERAIGKYL